MGGDLLGMFDRAAVFEVGGDAGRPEGVAADLGLDASRERPSANHPPDIGLDYGIAGQLAGSAASCEKAAPLGLG